ncbi:uncharacterized protein LOC124556487 [Schistocerca americana]|uniref:uncharacterized protein LOC124556487 n=1 Tax=Schistocerca americana TaxID=7009 RepID=UPI001F4F65A1|nr:uncharacterized protein LOC124556487 [Schistocerca americana]
MDPADVLAVELCGFSPPSVYRSMSEMKKKKWKLKSPSEKTLTESCSSVTQPSSEPRTLRQIPKLFNTLRLRRSWSRRRSTASEDVASRENSPDVCHKDIFASGRYMGIPILESTMLPKRDVWHCLQQGNVALHRVCVGHTFVTIKTRSDGHNSETALREVDILTEIRHTNILLLMGLLHMEGYHVVMVFEDVLDSLYNLIHEKKVIFTPVQKKSFMIQLCEVMIFLHDNGWLHTAISSHNTLVTKNYILKLSGFEYSQNIYKKYNFTETEAAQRMERYHWLAPEQLLNSAGCCKASDVFSTGIFFWELHTGEIPWSNMSAKELTKQYLDGTSSCLWEKSNIPSALKNILAGCLQPKVQMRKTSFINILENVSRIQAINRQEDKPVTQNQSETTVKRVRVSVKPLPYRSPPAEIHANLVDNTATKRQFEQSSHDKQTLKLRSQRLKNQSHNYENKLNTGSSNHMGQNSKTHTVSQNLKAPDKENTYLNLKRKDVSADKIAKCNLPSKKKVNDFSHQDKTNVKIGAGIQNLLYTVEELKKVNNKAVGSANSVNLKSANNLDKTTNVVHQERLGLLTFSELPGYLTTRMEENATTSVLHTGGIISKDSKRDVDQEDTSNSFVEDLKWNNKLKSLQMTLKTHDEDNFTSNSSTAKSEVHRRPLSRIKLLAFAIDIFVKKWEYEGKPIKDAMHYSPEFCIYNRIVRAMKRVSECYPHLFGITNFHDHSRQSNLNNTNTLSLNQKEIWLPKPTNGIRSSIALCKQIHTKQENKEMEFTHLNDEESVKKLPKLFTPVSSKNQEVIRRKASNQPVIVISNSNTKDQPLKRDHCLVQVDAQKPMEFPTELNILKLQGNAGPQLTSLIYCSLENPIKENVTQNNNENVKVPREAVPTEDLYFDDDFGTRLDPHMELLVLHTSSTQTYSDQ